MEFKTLSNLFKLSHRVTVYVPSKQRDGRPAPALVESTTAALADTFGGATASTALGYWRLATGEMQSESVTVVFAYAKELDETSVARVVTLAESIKAAANQESVAIELDGEMYFV